MVGGLIRPTRSIAAAKGERQRGEGAGKISLSFFKRQRGEAEERGKATHDGGGCQKCPADPRVRACQ